MKQTAKDLFIPHEGNAYAPNVLQRVSVGIMAVLVLLSFALANLQALLWIGSDWMVGTVLPAVIVELTNDERADDTLGMLTRNALLDAAATQKAKHMAQHEYFAHYSPDGTSPWHWFDAVAYDFVHAGENLAVHFSESDAVVHAWMDSPGHRANILNGDYTEIGVGTAQGTYKGFPTVFVVQLFGTPQAIAAPPETVTQEPPSTTTQPTTTTPTTTNNPQGAQPTPTTTPIETPLLQDTEVAGVDIIALPVVEEIALAVPTTTPATVASSEDTPPETSYASPSDTALLTEHHETAPAEETVHEVLVVYSDFATTSRSGVAAMLGADSFSHATSGGTAPTAGLMERSATQSSTWLQAVYVTLAAFVVIALVLSIVVEWRRQHPAQIAYGTGLLAGMALLFYAHTLLVGGVTIV